MTGGPVPVRVTGGRTPPLALRNVRHGGARSLAAVAGIVFVVVMVLLQLGFYGAVESTATNLYDELDFDIALVAPQYDQLYDTGAIPRERLRQSEALETVVAARPLYALFAMWRCPPNPVGRPPSSADEAPPGALRQLVMGADRPRPLQFRELLAIGIDLDRNPFRGPIRDRVEAAQPLLRQDDRVLMNERSNPDFGWASRGDFADWEMEGHAVAVVGGFPLQRGFGADGAVLCSDANFARLCPWPSAEFVNLGLLSVRPGTVAETVERLRAVLPPDVVVLSRDELFRREKDYWVNQTSTGKIVTFGLLVALTVAAVVVYQVLSNDIRSHLGEYATLKAIGYTNRFLASVVVAQALIYTVTAYVPAVVLAFGLYEATTALAGIPMRLTAASLGFALAFSAAVGLLAALLTVGKLRSADPADLY